MNNEIKDESAAETKIDPICAIAMENFEIEDISDLDLYSPLSMSFYSSACSS